jgi:hypothetical protein
MNCKECEEQIYLFDDLDMEEQQRLETHLIGCRTCAQLFQQWKDQSALISTSGSFTMVPVDSNRLTDKIMLNIYSDNKPSPVSFGGWEYLLRISFSLFSITLLLFFALEFYHGIGIKSEQRDKTGRSHASFLVSPSLQELRKKPLNDSETLYARLQQSTIQSNNE